jgi:hypothetical protein
MFIAKVKNAGVIVLLMELLTAAVVLLAYQTLAAATAEIEDRPQGEAKAKDANLAAAALSSDGKQANGRLNLDPPAIATDKSVKYDYPIVYVRVLRKGYGRAADSKFKNTVWAQAGVPLVMDPGADLMLLQPDGREEVLVAGGKGDSELSGIAYPAGDRKGDLADHRHHASILVWGVWRIRSD